MIYPSIRVRFISLILNVFLAFIIFINTSGEYFPTDGVESVWFISALSLWFLSLLSAPWFVPPRDTIVSGIGSLLIIVTMDIGIHSASDEIIKIRTVGAAYTIAIVVLSTYALYMHDKERRSPAGHLAFRITSTLGTGEILFSIPALLSIAVYYSDNESILTTLLLFWLFMAIAKPVERLLSAVGQYQKERNIIQQFSTVGSVVRVDHPNIVRVKLNTHGKWRPNHLFTASLPDGTQRYVLSMFSQIQGEDVICTGLCVGQLAEPIVLSTGLVCDSHDEAQAAEFLSSLSGSPNAELVGFVVENSSISVVSFEVSGRASLSEGDVVFTRIDNKDIFYQIIGAETFEESFDQNPRGTHVVRASQLGIFSPELGFTKYAWLPSMNMPLFAANSRKFDAPVINDREFEIGKVPSTNVAAIAKLDDLVEYHSAVLGVTGTGKTEMALDVVRQAVAAGTKVFCVDFTGDYRERLRELDPVFPSPTREQGEDLEKKLFAVETGTYGAPKEKKILQEGIDGLRAAAETQIDDFLRSDTSHLGIFELAEITNTKATLRLTELYLSTIMRWAQANRRKRQILIVLEEAHTIVPEVFGSGFDANTQFVVSRIGQIALQGRKYRVGLMVISQRTALVSKTILSQCNTFLTHSLIDQTSLNFLESVYSSQHTRLIPNLGRFEFLAFGKALKAERPIVLKRDYDPEKEAASLATGTKESAGHVIEHGADEPAMADKSGPNIRTL